MKKIHHMSKIFRIKLTHKLHNFSAATVNVVVKFTNETYDPDMAINGSASFENFKGKLNMSVSSQPLFGPKNFLTLIK